MNLASAEKEICAAHRRNRMKSVRREGKGGSQEFIGRSEFPIMVIVSANDEISAADDAIYHHSFPFTFNTTPAKCKTTFFRAPRRDQEMVCACACVSVQFSNFHKKPSVCCVYILPMVISGNPHENNFRLPRASRRAPSLTCTQCEKIIINDNKILENKFNFWIFAAICARRSINSQYMCGIRKEFCIDDGATTLPSPASNTRRRIEWRRVRQVDF